MIEWVFKMEASSLQMAFGHMLDVKMPFLLPIENIILLRSQ